MTLKFTAIIELDPGGRPVQVVSSLEVEPDPATIETTGEPVPPPSLPPGAAVIPFPIRDRVEAA